MAVTDESLTYSPKPRELRFGRVAWTFRSGSNLPSESELAFEVPLRTSKRRLDSEPTSYGLRRSLPPYRHSSSLCEPSSSLPRTLAGILKHFEASNQFRTSPAASRPFHGLPCCHAWFPLFSSVTSRHAAASLTPHLGARVLSLVSSASPRLDSASKFAHMRPLLLLWGI